MVAEINVPTKLNELTLEQYQAFMRVQDNSDSPQFISQKMVSIFCKIPLSQVLYINASSVAEIISNFNNMFEAERKFINRFEIGGQEFGFIPSLEEMSWGEFIDLENNISDWQTMHKAMAVMFRPIIKKKGEQYEIETYHSTANYSEVMKYAPLDVALGAVVFFYALGKELLNHTLLYIQGEMQTLTTKKANLQVDGDGIQVYMQSLKETLDGLTKLQLYPSQLVLPS